MTNNKNMNGIVRNTSSTNIDIMRKMRKKSISCEKWCIGEKQKYQDCLAEE